MPQRRSLSVRRVPLSILMEGYVSDKSNRAILNARVSRMMGLVGMHTAILFLCLQRPTCLRCAPMCRG